MTQESPLSLVSQQPILNDLVSVLQRFRERYEADPTAAEELRFSRSHVARAREQFGEMIRRGEGWLHVLCDLISDSLLQTYNLRSRIIGEIVGTGERFTYAVDISPEDLLATIDLDLGNRQLMRLRFADGDTLRRASLISNVVEYQAITPNRHAVYKLQSRIKAEEEIWNKVVDEIFDIDSIVLRDKELRHLSRYVKDVFGIKLVVGENDDVYKVQKTLAGLEFPSAALSRHDLPDAERYTKLEFIEVKDYLARKSRKRSGWSAMKSVVRWADRMFEIQVQPLTNYLHERELLTRASHRSFKAKREQVRTEVAERVPLFGFYRDLLEWLFVDPSGAAPTHAGVRVTLTE